MTDHIHVRRTQVLPEVTFTAKCSVQIDMQGILRFRLLLRGSFGLHWLLTEQAIFQCIKGVAEKKPSILIQEHSRLYFVV